MKSSQFVLDYGSLQNGREWSGCYRKIQPSMVAFISLLANRITALLLLFNHS